MKILLATDHYPPFIGGAHRQAQLLAEGMTTFGHEVAVATPWHGGLPPTDRGGEVTVHRIRQLRTAVRSLVRDDSQRHQPPFPDPVTILGLRRLIGEFRPDVVHAYGWLAFSVVAALRRKRIPLLLSARDYAYFCPNRTLLRKGEPCSGPGLRKCADCASDYYGPAKGLSATAGVFGSRAMVASRTTGLHSVSHYVSEVTSRYLFGPGGPPTGLVETVIPSFQTIEPAQSPAEDPAVSPFLAKLPDEPFILYVGAFRRVKGLEVLFDAYRRLESPPPLVMIGTYHRDTPPDFPPDTTILTDAPNNAVMAVWERAMFGVMPSLWPEPYGSTVAEGMNRGRPVIGTRPGGHADMIGADSELLVPAGDVDALASAMRMLIADPARRERYGREAAERAGSFAASAVLPRFDRAYREVLAAGAVDRGRT